MEEKPDKEKPKGNIIKKFILKANPGTYGKNHKKLSVDDIVEIGLDTSYHNIPISNPIRIYERKQNEIISRDGILILVFIILFVTLILLKFILNDFFVTERDKNFEFLLSSLCFAYISSYIFYLIVIKRSEIVNKREAFAIICGLTDTLISYGYDVYDMIAKGTDKEEEILKIRDKIDRETFKRICEQVDITKPHEGYNSNIGAVIILVGVKKIDFYKNKIYNYMPFLDGTFIMHLNKIQNSKFYRTITLLPNKKNTNIKEYSDDILKYFELLKEFEKYNNELKKKYLKNYEMKY
jgi:hypothetical protein